MDYFKKIERSVTISADKRSTVDLQVDVWSQDLNVTKFILKLDTTDSTAIDLADATVRVAMIYNQDGNDVKIEAAGIVEDVATQKIAYIMDDKLAGFEGLVIAGFYVTLSTGQRIDIQNVTFNMRKSLLDKDLEAAKESYYQTFDDIVADVQSEGEKVKTDINAVVSDVNGYGNLQKQTINDVVSDVQSTGVAQKEAINNVLTDVQSTADTVKSDINAILPTVQSTADTAKADINAVLPNVSSHADTQKQTIDSVVSDVQSTGETQKQAINAVLPTVSSHAESQKQAINAVVSDVNGYADSQKQVIYNTVTDVQSTGETQKQAIDAVVSDVQSTGDAAKTQINQVLPDVQSQVSAINTELAKIDENMPDLYVAYADYKSGNGFSKTDSSKLYKGYGVKDSNLSTDYRWERNIDTLQVGGRNLYVHSASNTFAGDLERKTTTTKIREKYGFKSEYKTTGISNVRCQQLQFNGINHAIVSFNAYVNTGTLNLSSDISDCYGNGRFIITTTNDRYSLFVGNINKYNTPDSINGFVDFTFTLAEGQTLYVEYIMVEYATTPSSWSPAPEEKASATELNELKSYIGYTDSDIYGVEIDMVNRRFTRLAGAVGKNGGFDFDNINAYKRRRCSVTNDGVVLAYCGEENFTESGVTYAEIVKNGVTYPIGTPVQAMVEQPKFYYKVVPLVVEPIVNGKGYHMRKGRYYISDYPKAGFKVHPAFIKNGVEHDKIYLSAYEGSIYDTSASAYLLNDEQVADFSTDLLSSIANAKPCSGLTQNLTRSNARLLAHNRGNGWEQQTIQTVSLTQLLFLIEYAKFNMQEVLGMGATQKTDDGSSNLAEKTGSTTSLGNASGAITNSNSIQIVSYRGEENPYGNIWKFVDGINVMANGIHEAYVADNDFSDKQSAGSYADVGFTLTKTNGYISAFGYSPTFDWLFLTSESTGNSNVPVGDYFYQNYTTTDDGGWRTVRLGASWFDGSGAGGFYWHVGSSSVTQYRTLSSRLVYLGG